MIDPALREVLAHITNMIHADETDTTADHLSFDAPLILLLHNSLDLNRMCFQVIAGLAGTSALDEMRAAALRFEQLDAT